MTTRRRHRKLEQIAHEILSPASSASFLNRVHPQPVGGEQPSEADVLVNDEHARHVLIENIFYEMDLEHTGVLDREEVSMLFRVLHR